MDDPCVTIIDSSSNYSNQRCEKTATATFSQSNYSSSLKCSVAYNTWTWITPIATNNNISFNGSLISYDINTNSFTSSNPQLLFAGPYGAGPLLWRFVSTNLNTIRIDTTVISFDINNGFFTLPNGSIQIGYSPSYGVDTSAWITASNNSFNLGDITFKLDLVCPAWALHRAGKTCYKNFSEF